MSVTFEVEPFLVNVDKEMVIKSGLAIWKVMLKRGLHEYNVVLEFPSEEDLSLDILYSDAASTKSLGIGSGTADAHFRDRWKVLL